MMIACNSRARKEGKERGKVKGKYGGNPEKQEGNGAIQSATCCTMCKKGSSGDWTQEVWERWQRFGPLLIEGSPKTKLTSGTAWYRGV